MGATATATFATCDRSDEGHGFDHATLEEARACAAGQAPEPPCGREWPLTLPGDRSVARRQLRPATDGTLTAEASSLGWNGFPPAFRVPARDGISTALFVWDGTVRDPDGDVLYATYYSIVGGGIVATIYND